MTIVTAYSEARRSLVRHAPLLALALAMIAVALLTLGPSAGVPAGGITASPF